jgi:ribosomal protein S18 acetylase RimI-like enzyme
VIEVKKIQVSEEKSDICNDILRALPEWFGIESAIVDYTKQVRTMPVYGVFDGGKAVGFVALKIHNLHTAEVYVMGILEAYHRQGIGKKLIACCEAYCREKGMEFLTVKTLDASRENESYGKTREFYLSVGFKPLEVFPLLWDENNPCLFLVKRISV